MFRSGVVFVYLSFSSTSSPVLGGVVFSAAGLWLHASAVRPCVDNLGKGLGCVVVVSAGLTVAAGALTPFLSKCGAVGWLGHQGLGVDDLAKGLSGGVVVREVGGLSFSTGCSVLCKWAL